MYLISLCSAEMCGWNDQNRYEVALNGVPSAIGNADDEIHLILSYETSQSFHKKFNNTTNKFSIRQIITHFKNFAFKTLTTFI